MRKLQMSHLTIDRFVTAQCYSDCLSHDLNATSIARMLSYRSVHLGVNIWNCFNKEAYELMTYAPKGAVSFLLFLIRPPVSFGAVKKQLFFC